MTTSGTSLAFWRLPHHVGTGAAALLTASLLGCGTPSDALTNVSNPALSVEAGYIALDAHDYSYSATDEPAQSVDYRASSTKLFYVFVPAESGVSDAPLFVISNGGPGTATTGNLLAFGTGPYSLRDGDPSNEATPNPSSWTQLGHLLYLDARQAGFSYATIEDPNDASARIDAFSINNFNLYLDAADFLRALLRFLAAHPDLRDRRIVLVGESYAGLRTSLMLNYLFDAQRLTERGAWYYTDPELADEIGQHFRVVFPGEDASRLAPATVARQFGHQLLIQPLIVPNYQFRYSNICSTDYGLGVRAEELGLVCPAEKPINDVHHLGKPAGWLAALAEQGRSALATEQGFGRLIGVDPRSIAGLDPGARMGAVRGADLTDAPADLSYLVSTLGELPSHDHYYLNRVRYGSALDDTDYGGQDTTSIKFGRFFLRNLPHVETFITRALLDSVINADRLPAALAEFVAEPDAILAEVTLDLDERPGIERPGWIQLRYTGNQFEVQPNTSRVIRFPTYRDAGHAVSASNPRELYLDIRDFMQATTVPR